jgi:NTP pyrophosphatase (non-canonical NTP hydrolase)
VIGEFLDAAKEETISALRAELARLQQSQHAQHAADSALASLQQKIDSLQVRTSTGDLLTRLLSMTRKFCIPNDLPAQLISVFNIALLKSLNFQT